ncbi:MAG: FkbM family methyltransferase [Bacteroidetes bacterium]|nr:FkbM family methyltransferase [Bacteroidota bacterium]
MVFTTKILRKISALTGYTIFKSRHAPVGYYLSTDVRHRLLLPMRTVFDVGANVGQTALELVDEFPEAKIYSFEPVQTTFSQLKQNVAAYPNVHCTHAALGRVAEKREIRLYPEATSLINSLNPLGMNNAPGATLETVTITTGEAFCKEKGIDTIDLLKIDTEGFELPVIEGFGDMLRNGKIGAIFCEVSFNPSDKAHTFINDLNDLVLGNGYTFYALYGMSNASIKVGRSYGNVLYVSPSVKEQLIC